MKEEEEEEEEDEGESSLIEVSACLPYPSQATQLSIGVAIENMALDMSTVDIDTSNSEYFGAGSLGPSFKGSYRRQVQCYSAPSPLVKPPLSSFPQAALRHT